MLLTANNGQRSEWMCLSEPLRSFVIIVGRNICSHLACAKLHRRSPLGSRPDQFNDLVKIYPARQPAACGVFVSATMLAPLSRDSKLVGTNLDCSPALCIPKLRTMFVKVGNSRSSFETIVRFDGCDVCPDPLSSISISSSGFSSNSPHWTHRDGSIVLRALGGCRNASSNSPAQRLSLAG